MLSLTENKTAELKRVKYKFNLNILTILTDYRIEFKLPYIEKNSDLIQTKLCVSN